MSKIIKTITNLLNIYPLFNYNIKLHNTLHKYITKKAINQLNY